MNEQIMHEEKKNGCVLQIIQDQGYDQSPDDDGDENLFLVGYHRDFTVTRDKIVTKDQCIAIFAREADEDEREAAKELKKRYHVFGLEAYIHSGVVLALSREGNFPDRNWDVSQLGAIFVARSEWKDEAEARKAALGLIKTWNDCMSGNVYGYVVNDERGEVIDSVWGYIGDWEQSGILDDGKASLKVAARPIARAARKAVYKKADIAQAEALVKQYGMKVSR